MSSAQAKRIIKQVEFYFSDSNLPRDKFLNTLMSKSEEKWCPIETIASFQRMKKITEDLSVVVAALKESTLLLVSEDGKNIKRKNPLPAEKINATPRCVYMKGFSETATLEEIQEIVHKEIKEGEKLLMTTMRRMKGEESKKFKGSVFLEFDSVETAERVSKLTIKLADDAEPMVIMMKADYVEMKKKEIAEKKANGEIPTKSKKRKNRDGEEKKEEKEPEITKDLIICVTGLGGECSREDVKACLEEGGGTVTYVEYARGQDIAYVRLNDKSELLASALCTKLNEGDTTIAEQKASFKALTGEEESSYWTKVRENQKNKRSRVRGHRN